MKPPPFEYACPATLAEAISLLAESAGTAMPIAGGQSLMPALAFRLSTPALLVDLRRLGDLDGIDISGAGVRLGAMVRWCDIEANGELGEAHPLLVAAVSHVAHYQIRNRGTIGGSLANADPAAELPGIAVTCDAEIHVTGPNGTRAIAAADFFLGPLATALEPDELIVEMSLPPWPSDRRWGFDELSRRRGDFALAGVALYYDVDGQGRATNAHVGVIGGVDRQQRLLEVEAMLNGHAIDAEVITAASAAAAAAVDPPEDIHASAEYRRALVAVLVERMLSRAAT